MKPGRIECWTEIIIHPEIKDDDVRQIMSKVERGIKTEKLRDNDLFVFRLNKKKRVICKTGVNGNLNKLLILKVLEDHNYNNISLGLETLVSDLIQENSEAKKIEIKSSYLYNDCNELIVLEEEQSKVLKSIEFNYTDKTMIITDGVAGAGKTLLAELMIQIAEGKKTLFTSKSSRLVSKVKEEYNNTEEKRGEVHFKTYDNLCTDLICSKILLDNNNIIINDELMEYIGKVLNGENNTEISNLEQNAKDAVTKYLHNKLYDKDKLIKWIQTHPKFKSYLKEGKKPKLNYDSSDITVQKAREIAEDIYKIWAKILDQISKDNNNSPEQLLEDAGKTLDLGKKESYGHKISKQMCKLYYNYLKSNNAIDLSLLDSQSLNSIRDTENYDLIIIDEGQDFEKCAFLAIEKLLAPNGVMHVFLDTHQSIYQDFNASIKYLKDLSFNKDQVKEHVLVANYRSPPNVVKVAKLLLEWKQKVIGGNLNTTSNSKVPKSIDATDKDAELMGYIGWCSPKEAEFNKLKADAINSTDVVILVPDASQINEAERVFDKEKSIILTVEQSKGLEFAKVVLFNFCTSNSHIITPTKEQIDEEGSASSNYPKNMDNAKIFAQNSIFYNGLHIAVTRSTHSIYFVETKQTKGSQFFKKNAIDKIIAGKNNEDTTIECDSLKKDIELLEKIKEASIDEFPKLLNKVISKINKYSDADINTRDALRSLMKKILAGKKYSVKIKKGVVSLLEKLDKVDNESDNYVKLDNHKLKTHLDESQASSPNYNDAQSLSTGAIPKKRTIHKKQENKNEVDNESDNYVKLDNHKLKTHLDESQASSPNYNDAQSLSTGAIPKKRTIHKKQENKNEVVIPKILDQMLKLINKKSDKKIAIFIEDNIKEITSNKESLTLNDLNVLRDVIYNNLLTTAKLLIDRDLIDVNAKISKVTTPLHLALSCRCTELAKLFILKGADPNATDNYGITPLYLAALNKQPEVAKLLLENGANPNPNADKIASRTPLHWAAENGDTEIVKLLLDNKADPNTKTKEHLTPLHFAAQNGHTGLSQLLIEKGGDVNTTCCNNITPLHKAIDRKNEEVVKLLLENGANVNITINYTPKPEMRDESIKKLITAKQKIDEAFFTAVRSLYTNQLNKQNVNKELGNIEKLLEQQHAYDFKPGFYSTFGPNNKGNIITLAALIKDQKLLELLLNYAVKIKQVKPIKDLLNIKDDKKTLVDSEYIKTLLEGLKNDDQKVDIEQKNEIIKLLTAEMKKSLPANNVEADSNPSSKDSDARKSELYADSPAENTNSEIEVGINYDNEPEQQLAGSQNTEPTAHDEFLS